MKCNNKLIKTTSNIDGNFNLIYLNELMRLNKVL